MFKLTKYIKPLILKKIKYKASPNKSGRPNNITPTHIVLHHTGPGSFSGIVKWLRNPIAKASAHYVLGKKGQLTQLVGTKKKAWHAGRSYWCGKNNVNDFSIGIEICNIGILNKEGDVFTYERGRDIVTYSGDITPVSGEITLPNGDAIAGWYVPYPDDQIKKLIELCKALVKKYPAITANNIITHYNIAPYRKNDPFGLDINYIKRMVFDLPGRKLKE